jgi:putative oxidoreductase
VAEGKRGTTNVKFLDRLHPLALLALRVVLGIIMIAHGYPKVTNIPKTMGMLHSLSIPQWMAYLTAAAEFAGGILLIVGLLTRLAALAVCIDLIVAIDKVHWKNGLRGPMGFEFPMSVATIAFALIFLGAGAISLDAVLFGGGGGTGRSR